MSDSRLVSAGGKDKHHIMARALIFDSGVGGLSVVAEIRKRLPDLELTYVADDAYRPYGEKSEVELRGRLSSLLSILYDMSKPDLIVVACNTASTTALDVIRNAVPCPVVGVVPAIKPAAENSRTRTIGVLGTPGTVQRKYVDSLIQEFAGDCHVVLQGSVGLVDLAERKLAGETLKKTDIQRELMHMFDERVGADIDTIVLACTHFPLLRDELKEVSPQSVTWIDSGEAIARRVEAVLLDLETTVKRLGPDVALLVGSPCEPARQQAFGAYGFSKVVALEPD